MKAYMKFTDEEFQSIGKSVVLAALFDTGFIDDTELKKMVEEANERVYGIKSVDWSESEGE